MYQRGSLVDIPLLYHYVNPKSQLEKATWLEILLVTGFTQEAVRKIVESKEEDELAKQDI